MCEAGAQYPTSASDLPAVIVIGDSVSIGYTPFVAASMNESGTAFVQHSPWGGGGGADDVGNGVRCEEWLLRTSTFDAQSWRLISFNFGLHNLDNSSTAEATYAQLLANFTTRLLAEETKVMFVTTTPYMPARWFGDMVVEQLNALAVAIMAKAAVPVADLYSHVTAYCGAVYMNCSICDDGACAGTVVATTAAAVCPNCVLRTSPHRVQQLDGSHVWLPLH